MSLSPFDSFQSQFVTYLLNFPLKFYGSISRNGGLGPLTLNFENKVR